MNSKRSVFLAIFAAFLAAGILVTHSAALSVSTSAVNFPGLTLNGYDQILAGSTAAWQVDASGEAGGWHATILATNFGNGAGGIIDVGYLEFRLADANISLVSGDPVLPTSTQTSFVPLSGTAIKFISAASGTSDGIYDFLPEFQLTVPAETYYGTYTNTITIAINTGP